MVKKYLLAILTIVFIIFINFLFNKWEKLDLQSLKIHWANSSHSYSKVKIKTDGMPLSLLGTTDGKNDFKTPTGEDYYYICKSETCKVSYPLRSEAVIKKVELFFAGHYPLESNQIQFELDNKLLAHDRVLRTCSDQDAICTYNFKDSFSTSSVTVVISESTPHNIGINDIQFYSGHNNNILLTLYNFMFVHPRSLRAYIVYPILFALFYLIPGVITAEIMKKSEPNLIEVIFHSTIILSILSLLNLVIPQNHLKPTAALLFSCFFFFLIKRRDYTYNLFIKEKTILLIYIISILFLSGIMFIRDYPAKSQHTILYNDFYSRESLVSVISHGTYETDFLIPLETGLNFQKGGEALKQKIGMIYRITDRTPLISFLLLIYTKIFDQSMFTYQMFTIVMANLFIIASYYVARLYVDKVKSVTIALVLAFSHFFAFISLYWPQKTIALFFVLSSLYYILRRKSDYFMAGLHMMFAALLHLYVVVYYLSFALFVFWKKYIASHSPLKSFKTSLGFALPTAVAFLVWTIYSISLGQTSAIYWSVFSQNTWNSAAESIKDGNSSSASITLVQKLFSNQRYWQDKWLNFVDLFVFSNHKGMPTRLFDFYKLTIPGALSLVGSLFFLIVLAKSFFTKNKLIFLGTLPIGFFLIVLPLSLTITLHGFYIRTGVMSYLLGIVPLMLLFIARHLPSKYFAILGFFLIGESLWVYFIHDELMHERLASFYPDTALFMTILFSCVTIFALRIIYLNTHRAEQRIDN